MKTANLLLPFVILLLAVGCAHTKVGHELKEPSEAQAARALTAYFKKVPACILMPYQDSQIGHSMSAETLDESHQAFLNAGLVELRRHEDGTTRLELTPVGKRFYRTGFYRQAVPDVSRRPPRVFPGFCYGKRVLVGIGVRESPKKDITGDIVSVVHYTYKIERYEGADWVENASIRKVYEDETLGPALRLSGVDLTDELPLRKTWFSWKHPRLPKRRFKGSGCLNLLSIALPT